MTGRENKKEENLSDFCEGGDGVAEVVVDIQPGRWSSRLPRGVWGGCGKESCDPRCCPGRVLQSQVDQNCYLWPPQQILSNTNTNTLKHELEHKHERKCVTRHCAIL